MSKLIPEVCDAFLRLPCESIPPWQRFHLVDKLITAREFNAHVQRARTMYARLQNRGFFVYSTQTGGAHTVRTYYSDYEIRITHTVRCPSCTHTKFSMLWP